MDANQTQFGEVRLQTLVRKNFDRSPEELMERIKQSLSDFVQDSPQFDDITVVIAKRREVPKELT